MSLVAPPPLTPSAPTPDTVRRGGTYTRTAAGNTSRVAAPIFTGDTGITSAVYAYGAALRAVHETARFAPEDDIGVSVLSQWTDNGQIYDGDFWALPGKARTAGALFPALLASLRNASIPVGSLQLDPFWFASGEPGIKDWTPSPDVWGPGGFEATLAAGARPTLYAFLWATPEQGNVFSHNFSFLTGPRLDNFMKGPFGRPSAASSAAFHALLMARCRSYGCIGFELDFVDFNYFGFGQEDMGVAGNFEAFLVGLSSAGAAAGVPVQLCMPLPSDLLTTVLLPGVSNVRASDDNDLQYAPAGRWRIGLTSLLHGALDMRPFFDGTWSMQACAAAQASETPYPASYCQNASELGVVVSTLSTGPLGIGDAVGRANTSLLAMAVASNGVILKPSLPASPVDITYRFGPRGGPAGAGGSPILNASAELWAAPSFLPDDVAAAVAEGVREMGRHGAPPIATGQSGRGVGIGVAAGAVRKCGGLARFTPRGRYAAPAVPRPGGNFPIITACPYVSLLAVDLPDSLGLVLQPGDLTPSLATMPPNGTGAARGVPTAEAAETASAPVAACDAAGYVALPWSPGTAALSERCADGASALACGVVPFSESSGGLRVSTGAVVPPGAATLPGAPHAFEIWSLSPVSGGGWGLLGELGKFVRASPVRFSGAGGLGGAQGLEGLSLVVEGAPGERVDVALLVPGEGQSQPFPAGLAGSTIKRLVVGFPTQGGSALVQCAGAGAAANCAVALLPAC